MLMKVCAFVFFVRRIVGIVRSRCGVSACAWPLLPIMIDSFDNTTRKTLSSLPDVWSSYYETLRIN